jgi:Fe-S cluster biogenesis protein NfuA/nitrite reductase/ring-hydroxylating ferredoxin subunit
MEFDQAVAELDTLIETLERDNDERALMLLQLVDAIHRPALELIVAGELDHPVAAALLSMYDLAAIDQRIQVEEALDEIRPYIESHGGDLELLDVDDGIVHVRMSGACHGCAASAMTLRRGIEEKLRERYPGFKEVVAHEPENGNGGNGANGAAAAPLLQIERPGLIQIEGMKRPVFEDAGPLADLPAGEMKSVDLDEGSILIANIDGEPYAFRNTCPVDGDREMPLDGGRLTGTVLVCPWHNCAYDARSGKRVDDQSDGPALAVVPVAVRDGMLKVAVNVA